MFIPISDDNTDVRLFPVVNSFLIIVTICLWCIQLHLGDLFTFGYCLVPYEIWHNVDLHQTIDYQLEDGVVPIDLFASPHPIYITIVTSLFLHSSWGHLIVNMLFLYIFGDQIEDRLGHVQYLAFYFLCGVISMLCETAISVDSIVPMLGASGAISGALGAYFINNPTNKVRALISIIPVNLPAFLVLGFWFISQISIDVCNTANGFISDVAYSAHLGGFVTGMMLVLILPERRQT